MPRPELIWGEAFFAGSLAQLIARLGGLPTVLLLAWEFGAISLATGPTVVNPMVHQIRLQQLDNAGVPGGGSLKGLVFLMILLTVGIQGFTAPVVLARQLNLV